MKFLGPLFLLLALVSCSSENGQSIEQPAAPWTYPITNYQVVQAQASRNDGRNITRLVGWDEGFYFFDWSRAGAAITRVTARVKREEFDLQNRGAPTLAKGRVTVRNGQVRTLILE